jgi:RNA polymerase sigma factor (sigma-70 family)
MEHARDAEDALLLERGEHAELLAAYRETIVDLCLVRVRGEAGYDVAQDVFLRLWAELRRGKRYPVPFRVVVFRVIGWTVQEHFQGRPTDLPLPEGWDPVGWDDGYRAFEEDADLAALFGTLPARECEVATLRYREGLEPDEIAARVGITTNNVYQALFRAHAKLRERIDAG